jgi:hypothetical protein
MNLIRVFVIRGVIVKTRKNRHKTRAYFYEHNREQGEAESIQNMILHRRKQANIGRQQPLRMIKEACPARV